MIVVVKIRSEPALLRLGRSCWFATIAIARTVAAAAAIRVAEHVIELVIVIVTARASRSDFR